MKNISFTVTLVVVWFVSLQCDVAFAKDHRMVQTNKTFVGDVNDQEAEVMNKSLAIAKAKKVETLNVKVGDQIVFSNLDVVSHNINGVQGSDTIFDVGEQPPGKSHDRVIKIQKTGETLVECRIHPKMKFKIKAE